MKRSSTYAALDEGPSMIMIDGGVGGCGGNVDVVQTGCVGWSYQDDGLSTSMMMVSIHNDSDVGLVSSASSSSLSLSYVPYGCRRPSLSSTSTISASSSRGSLIGWGTAASRKSYKVDLCALADEIECDQQPTTATSRPSSKTVAIAATAAATNQSCTSSSGGGGSNLSQPRSPSSSNETSSSSSTIDTSYQFSATGFPVPVVDFQEEEEEEEEEGDSWGFFIDDSTM